MDNIKKYRNIILVVIIILGFIFYWYEWRPREIRKECNIEALKEVEGGKGSLRGSEGITLYDFVYTMCVRKKGL